jgi:hypothetical protein
MTITELKVAAAVLGYRLVKVREPKTHCRLGHLLRIWPSGEKSCPACKLEGVRRRRDATRQLTKKRRFIY